MSTKNEIIDSFAALLGAAEKLYEDEISHVHAIAITTDNLIMQVQACEEPIAQRHGLLQFLQQFRSLARSRYFDDRMILDELRLSNQAMLATIRGKMREEDRNLQ